MTKLTWKVFYYSMNKRIIYDFDIFEHISFLEDVKKALKTINNKQEFAKELKSLLMYYFWSKCEYEVVITPFSNNIKESEKRKVDVYTQVMLNWEVFLNYVWSFSKIQKKELQRK